MSELSPEEDRNWPGANGKKAGAGPRQGEEASEVGGPGCGTRQSWRQAKSGHERLPHRLGSVNFNLCEGLSLYVLSYLILTPIISTNILYHFKGKKLKKLRLRKAE